MKRVFSYNKYLTGLFLSIVLVYSVLGMPKTVYSATPSVDAVSSGTPGNNSITWQHTIGNNTNRLLIIFAQTNSQTAPTVKVDGVTVPKAAGLDEVTVGIAEYDLFNPSVGTHTIAVTGGSNLMAGAVSIYNVNQADPWDSNAGFQLTGSCVPSGGTFCFGSYKPSTTTLLWFQVFALDNGGSLTITPMSTGTRMWTMHAGTKYFAAEYLPGVTGTITPSWTVSPQPPFGSNVVYEALPVLVADVIPTAIPTPTPTPIPTPATYTISGNVFNDFNKNGLEESGESNYSGIPNISASRGTVTTQAGGSYSISNLPAGTVTISFNTLPSGYSLTYPLNGPPPSYQVTVGPSCLINGAVGASCR